MSRSMRQDNREAQAREPERQARAQEPATYEVPCGCGAEGCMDTIDPTDNYEGDDR